MKILIVDDDKDICQLIADIFKEAGCSVKTTCNGEEALANLKQQRHDVMILDHGLSGICGLSVLEKARQIRPFMRTIMISGFGDESIKSRAKELGAYDFLDKPFDIEKLVNVVREALREDF